MIKFLKNWCEGISVAIFIAIIIEMLLPDGNNKKYVKVIIGIYIVFVVLNPLLTKINNGIQINNIFNIENVATTSANLNNNIKNVYIVGIEENIKNEIFEKGYNVIDVKIQTDINYENIEKIEIKLDSKNIKKDINKINPVVISKEHKENEDEFIELKKHISENYEIDSRKIYIK